MPLTVEQFTNRLVESSILHGEQLRNFIAALPENSTARSNAEEMARELVRQKKLTKYQAEQIYAGQGESLTLGNYVILDKLGQGGMGIVLKAEHKRMKRLVAIKVMSPAAVKTPDALRRFHREVEAAAKLRHPNIVAADDADEARGTHFLVMEYVEGSDLSAHVKRNGPFPVEQAVNCVIQAARGLEYAHKRGVVHRDIKPANLLLDREGTVKILDMGLARIEGEIGAQAELTSTGAVMGTVDYMAPEQARNTKTADARSDIYSLGISLWYLLTGRPVFDGQTLTERLLAHQTDPIPSLTEAVTRVGRVSQAKQEEPSTIAIEARDFASSSEGRLTALDAVFRRMVAKKPGDRPQSMTEVIADLERCLVQGKPDFGSATVTFVSSEELPRQVAASLTEVALGSGFTETMISADGDSQPGVVRHSSKLEVHVSEPSNGGQTVNDGSKRSSAAIATSRRWMMIGALVACLVLGVGLSSFLNRSHRRTDSASNSEQIRPATDATPAKSDLPSFANAPFDARQSREYQKAWAKHLGTEVESTNSVGQKMVLLPPGEFLMGSSAEQVAAALKAAADMKADRGVIGRIESSERPQHRVVISKPLQMSATEVTVGQFKRFVAASKYVTEAERYGFGDSAGTVLNDKVTETQRQSNWRSPGYTVDDNSPVAQITWNDAVAYCKWLSDQEKITYRLPTEAEWEYACRAGTTTQYSFGDDYIELPKYGWPIENAVIQSHPVGTQLPNSFGLFDMHGNLYEWCSDYFEANWYAASPVSDPIGPVSGSNRVLRGGSIHNGPSQCRSASRYSNSPSGRYKDYGFRCVAELQVPADASARSQTFGSEEWIDVMPLLKPEVDKVDIGRSLVGKNDWRIDDGELRYYGDDKSGKLYFPVRCLGRSLECEFEFTRTAGNISFNMDIPIPDGFVPLTIGNDRIGFVNESLTDKFQIVNGQRTKLRLRVTQAGADDRLEVFVNDQPLVDWKGKLAKHKIVPPRTDARNPSEHFSLFAHGPTNYSFRAIRMRMLNGGSAKSLRPAAANAKPWIDWLGPKVQRGDFDVNPNGWVREGEAVTTEHVISGIEVLPPTTRDGAIRVTYLLRDSKGVAINARDHLMDNDSDFRELYVVEDLRDSLRLAYARAGQQDRSLATQPIGADVSKDLPRTLEFRVVGDTLTVKLNGSLVSTVKDSTIPVGNFALVALKGVLIQKVEYQSLDSLK